MSGKVMGHVWDLDLPHNKLIVLLAYTDHAQHDGRNIYPSVGLIAWKTGYSERQVQRITKELVKDELLIPEGVASKGTNKYRFNWFAGQKKEPYKGEDESQNVTPVTEKVGGDKMSPGDITVSPGGRHIDVTPGGDTQMSPEPSVKPSIKPPVVENEAIATAGKAFKMYEDMCPGGLTGYISDKLKDAIKEFSDEWVIDAIEVAIENNKRNWRYCDAILRRWQRDGKDDGRTKKEVAYHTMSPAVEAQPAAPPLKGAELDAYLKTVEAEYGRPVVPAGEGKSA